MDTENQVRGSMNCAELAGALLLASDGELDRQAVAALDAHLSQCQTCRARQSRFRQMDDSLLECREILESISPSRRDARARRSAWRAWLPPDTLGRWAALSLAGLIVVAMLIVAPRDAERRDVAKSSRDHIAVIQVELPLAPVGNPFLDASQSESSVAVDVSLDLNGRPQSWRLADWR